MFRQDFASKLKWFVAAYVILVGGSTALIWYLNDIGVMQHLLGELKDGFMASWYEDVVFFTFVGGSVSIALTISLALHQRDNESFDTRVAALGNASVIGSNPELRSHVSHQLKRAGVITTYNKCTIRFREFIPSMDAYRVRIEFELVIANIFRDEVNNAYEAMFYAEADDVVTGNDLLGEVEMLRGFRAGQPIEIAFEHTKLSRATPAYRQQVNLDLDPNGEARYLFEYWIYAKVGEVHTTNVRQYTHKLKIHFVNETGSCVPTVSQPTRVKAFSNERGVDEQWQIHREREAAFASVTGSENIVFRWHAPSGSSSFV